MEVFTLFAFCLFCVFPVHTADFGHRHVDLLIFGNGPLGYISLKCLTEFVGYKKAKTFEHDTKKTTDKQAKLINTNNMKLFQDAVSCAERFKNLPQGPKNEVKKYILSNYVALMYTQSYGIKRILRGSLQKLFLHNVLSLMNVLA